MKKPIRLSPSPETLESRSLLTASSFGHALGMSQVAHGPVPAADFAGMRAARQTWASAMRSERAALRHANMLRFLEMRSALRRAPMPLVVPPAAMPLSMPAVSSMPVLTSPSPAPASLPAAMPVPPVFVSVPPQATTVPVINAPPASMPPAAPINSGANLAGPVPTNPPAAPVSNPPAAPAPTSTDSPPIMTPAGGGMPDTVIPTGSTTSLTGGNPITIADDGTAQIAGTLAGADSSDVYTVQAPKSGRLTFSIPPGGDPVKLTAQAADGTVLVTILADRPNFISYINVAAGASYTITVSPIAATPASYSVALKLS